MGNLRISEVNRFAVYCPQFTKHFTYVILLNMLWCAVYVGCEYIGPSLQMRKLRFREPKFISFHIAAFIFPKPLESSSLVPKLFDG